jgi:GNAT superfamily N-acetyltransferase
VNPEKPEVTGPIEVRDPETIEQITRFRFDSWLATGLIIPEAFPGRAWRDDLDDVARHFVLEVDGRLSASIRYAQFDRLEDMPLAAYYRSHGLDLDGPIGLPERMTVLPGMFRMGLMKRLADHVLEIARESGARYLISEATQRCCSIGAGRSSAPRRMTRGSPRCRSISC